MSTAFLWLGIAFAGASVASFVAHAYAAGGKSRVRAADVARGAVAPFDVVLDVRTRVEWRAGHHPGARHLPATSIDAASAARVIPSKASRVLTYCNTGQRARAAAEKLRALGYAETYYIAESYAALS